MSSATRNKPNVPQSPPPHHNHKINCRAAIPFRLSLTHFPLNEARQGDRLSLIPSATNHVPSSISGCDNTNTNRRYAQAFSLKRTYSFRSWYTCHILRHLFLLTDTLFLIHSLPKDDSIGHFQLLSPSKSVCEATETVNSWHVTAQVGI